MRTTCKTCHKPFTPERAGAQYCSPRCRTAAWRRRKLPEPHVVWLGKTTKLRTWAKSNTELSNAELAEHLVRLSIEADAPTDEHGNQRRDKDDNLIITPKTGRRFYYLALSHGYINPDMRDTEKAKKSRDAAYDRVTNLLGELRKSGDIAWTAVLDLTRELDEWQTYDSPREARAAMRRRYTEDRWLGQPYYPVLIVEKDTLEPLCKTMARRWQMPFASSRGYSSLTLQHDVATMLERRWAKTKQTPIVYFVSDLDPSGMDLQRAWEEALSDFGVPAIFVRIGLTHEQVDTHDLDRFAIEVKPSDSRSKAFVEKYGRRCWEADVLPASVIEDAIRTEVELRLNRKQWDQRDREIERARALLC